MTAFKAGAFPAIRKSFSTQLAGLLSSTRRSPLGHQLVDRFPYTLVIPTGFVVQVLRPNSGAEPVPRLDRRQRAPTGADSLGPQPLLTPSVRLCYKNARCVTSG